MYIVHPDWQKFKDLLESVKTECDKASCVGEVATVGQIWLPPRVDITDEEKRVWREWGERNAAATDEPQDIPGPPTPGPAETKIVRIHWKDACSVQGWHFQHEIEEQGLSLVESVGWLVGEDDSCVKLAISVSEGVAGNMTVIPKSGIVDRWEFKGE